MFVVVDIAGFQEKVTEGDLLSVPLLDGNEGDKVVFHNVMLVAKTDTDVQIGMPTVDGASVEAKIIGHGRGDKIRVFKMKRRKRYRRLHGHRQDFTDIEIVKITLGGPVVKTEKKEVAKKEVSSDEKSVAKKEPAKKAAPKKAAKKSE